MNLIDAYCTKTHKYNGTHCSMASARWGGQWTGASMRAQHKIDFISPLATIENYAMNRGHWLDIVRHHRWNNKFMRFSKYLAPFEHSSQRPEQIIDLQRGNLSLLRTFGSCVQVRKPIQSNLNERSFIMLSIFRQISSVVRKLLHAVSSLFVNKNHQRFAE